MDDEKLRKLLAAALKHARRFGPAEIAEDVAQEVCLQALEGHGEKQRIKFAVIDALRKLLGRTGSARAEFRELSLDAMLEKRFDAPAPDQTEEQDERREFDSILPRLSPEAREVAVLFAIEDMSMAELARYFGRSYSWVFERLREAAMELA